MNVKENEFYDFLAQHKDKFHHEFERGRYSSSSYYVDRDNIARAKTVRSCKAGKKFFIDKYWGSLYA